MTLERVILDRRNFLGIAVGCSMTALAGCLEGENDDGSGDSDGFGSASSDSNCQTVTQTRTQTVADETETVSAGADWVFHGDRESGDVIIVEARKIGGEARPALEIEDPHGQIIASSDPSTQIRREVNVRQDGRYYIRFHNKAFVNSGMWDVKVDVEYEYEEEVCD